MEGEARYTYVGIAMIALVAALVGSIIWLTHPGGRGEFAYYAIYFEHQPLDGLQVGSDVTVRGIKVGRVERYALQPENIRRVLVVIRVDHGTRLSNDMAASVSRNMLTGVAYIRLEPPDPPGPPLALATSPEGHLPEIVESSANVDLAAMAAETLRRLNDVLRSENREALSATLLNVRDLTAGLNARLGAIDRSLLAFNSAVRDVGRAGARTASLAGSTERELVPAVRQAHQTMSDISATAVTIRSETATLAQRVGQTAGSTDDQLTLAGSQLRTAVEAIDRMLERLRDPRAALFGPDRAQRGPGE